MIEKNIEDVRASITESRHSLIAFSIAQHFEAIATFESAAEINIVAVESFGRKILDT